MSLLLNSVVVFFIFLVLPFAVCRCASSHGRVGSDAAIVVGVERDQTSGRAFGSTCGARAHVCDGLVVDLVHA